MSEVDDIRSELDNILASIERIDDRLMEIFPTWVDDYYLAEVIDDIVLVIEHIAEITTDNDDDDDGDD